MAFGATPSLPGAGRFADLPRRRLGGHVVPVARGARSRLLGLAWLDADQVGSGLLIPRCSAVHTFGMRFALDLVFLDRRGRPLCVRRAVPPCRFVRQRGAAAVLEIPAAEGGEFASPRT